VNPANGNVLNTCEIPFAGGVGDEGNDTLAVAHPGDLGGKKVLLSDAGEFSSTTLFAIDPVSCQILKQYALPVGVTGVDEDPVTKDLVATNIFSFYDLGPAPYATIRGSFPTQGLVEGISLEKKAISAPPPHNYVVFIRGINSSLTQDEIGRLTLAPCSDPANDPDYGDIKKATFDFNFGYLCGDFLQYSYEGGSVGFDGSWHPAPYTCKSTGNRLEPYETDSSSQRLYRMLSDFHAKHSDATFTIVGHSLGGLVSFLTMEGITNGTLTPSVPIQRVITLDSPLEGASSDLLKDLGIRLKHLFSCPADLSLWTNSSVATDVKVRSLLNTRLSNAQSVQKAHSQSISVDTFGNWDDCVWSLYHCMGLGDPFG
jgi:hypothetical protein